MPVGIQEDRTALKVFLSKRGLMRFRVMATITAVAVTIAGCNDPGGADPEPLTSLNVQERVSKTLNEAASDSVEQRDYNAAVVYYARLLERDPENPELLAGLARSLRLVKQPAQAKGYIEQGLLKHKDHPLLLAELGKSQLALGDSMDAIETLSNADTLDPNVWETILALAVAFDRVSMYDQSKRRYLRAMELAPKNFNVLNNYGLSLAQSGEFEKATKLLEEAARLPEATSQVRQNLAMMYALQGEMEKAEGLLRRDLSEKAANQNMEYYRSIQSQKKGGLPEEVLRRLDRPASTTQRPAGAAITSGIEMRPVEAIYRATKETIIRNAPTPGATRVALLDKGATIYVAGITTDGAWALVEQDQKVLGYAVVDHLQSVADNDPTVKAAPVAPVASAKPVTQPAPVKPVTTTTSESKPAAAAAAVPVPRAAPAKKDAIKTAENTKTEPAASKPDPKPVPSAPAKPSANNEYRVGQTLKDCPRCPDMVVIPSGEFMMGAAPGEPRRSQREMPQHKVVIPAKISVSKFEITFADWDVCVADGGCNHRPGDEGWGRERRPAINVSWHDAQEYVNWLSQRTGKVYRLLSEAEWEYAARAGTETAYHTGTEIKSDQGRFKSTAGASDQEKSLPVGRYAPNLFGLYDMHGNVREWTEDCRHDNYREGPSDGAAWVAGGNCDYRVIRGGSWGDRSSFLRSAYRSWTRPNSRSYAVGLRVGRELN
jgi:formylglycine-generating enzyme required for sulfatase activity/Flp pilus assembly protein TadD